MDDARSLLESRLLPIFDSLEAGSDPIVRASDRADFQANGTIALAKRLGRRPDEVAREVVASVDLKDICERVEVSGPGFINLTLSREFIATRVLELSFDDKLGVHLGTVVEHYVVDYSAPNAAKEMHVGHLRSTDIGDAICRILTFCGQKVTRENHIGDWGTPFGMLIEHLIDLGEDKAVHALSIGDLDTFYKSARSSFELDADFQDRARARVVLLQAGDRESLRLWGLLVDESVAYFDEVYARLGVLLTKDDVVGESFYNPELSQLVEELDKDGLLIDSDGARCVFPPGFSNREGEPLPLIVQKSDGGFGYAATDLAAIRDRTRRVGATRLVYVVGSPQAQHFQMCFAVAALAGWLGDDRQAVHVAFGNVLDASGKMFKTRAGETVKLVGLLEDAIKQARASIDSRDHDLSPDLVERTAEMIGIGAVKYADLATDRVKDYVFDLDRMLSFEGNTGPYLQYAHARICSIFRRGKVEMPGRDAVVRLDEREERALAMKLLAFPSVVSATVETFSPSKLCGYLFELATAFTSFYENCPVLRSDGELQVSRLLLSGSTASVLKTGLGLLGISAPEQM